MAKVIFSSSDLIVTTVMDERESAEIFGQDFVDEFGKEIPDELLIKYKSAHDVFWNIQKELDKYCK